MIEAFKIYTDRLKKGVSQALDFSADPSFLEINESELQFKDPVQIWGEAYLADSDLVLRLKITTKALLPCSICNKPVSFPIEIESLYFTKPLSEIPSHVFDFSSEVREAVLLEVPYVVECEGGKCPEREQIAKFLAPPKDRSGKSRSEDELDGWQPFKDL